MRYLDPKNDLTFKRIFAENSDLLRGCLKILKIIFQQLFTLNP